MFGSYYVRRDEELRGDHTQQAAYTRSLLAELLTRARTLYPPLLRAIEAEHDHDRAGYLEDLARGVEVFLKDVDEAAVRAQRARICAEGDFGELSDDIAVGDLDGLGGELVSVEDADG